MIENKTKLYNIKDIAEQVYSLQKEYDESPREYVRITKEMERLISKLSFEELMEINSYIEEKYFKK